METSMSNETSKTASIRLNNFLHRIESKAAIMAMANEHACTLKRIRRSRNWALTGNHSQLVNISHTLRQENILWIAEAIDKSLPKPTFNLTLIVKTNPAITVNQLISKTGCSLVEARSAIDTAEGFI